MLCILHKHTNTVHDKIKDFYCIVCENTRTEKCDLKDHTTIEYKVKKDSDSKQTTLTT